MKSPPFFAALALGAAFIPPSTIAFAQVPSKTQAKPAAAKADANKKPLSRVLQAMQYTDAGARQANAPGSQGDPFLLATESSIAETPVSPISGVTTAATVESQLDALVKELPKGTRWVKLMLPPPPTGKTLKGDDLADFALAQARLYGSVGEAVLPAGSVEVLSQTVPGDKAATVVPALRLQPVYLLVNPAAHNALSRGVRDFGDLTPEQQKNWAKNAAPMFMNMTPKERMEAFQNMTGQISSLIEAVVDGMSPEQARQFFTEMGGKTTEHSAEIPIAKGGGSKP